MSTSKRGKNKQRFVGSEGEETPDNPAKLSPLSKRERKSLDLTSVRAERERRKRERSERGRRAAKTRAAKAKEVAPAKPRIDWLALEEGTGAKPDKTFVPGPKRQARWQKTLSAAASNKQRKALESDLGRKVALIYTRYRRAAQGGSYGSPEPQEMKYCNRIGRLCVLKGLRPYQVIKYWHANIGNFTGMRLPPLPFLASPGNIDQASLDTGEDPKQRAEKAKSPVVHSFANVDGLHPGLRRGLLQAGFDMGDFSDRHLLTVQSTAAAVAQGHSDMFIPSKLRPMVDWILKNLTEATSEN